MVTGVGAGFHPSAKHACPEPTNPTILGALASYIMQATETGTGALVFILGATGNRKKAAVT